MAEKTKEQRKRVLLAVRPDMSLVHRPDYDAFRKKGKQGPTRSAAQDRAAYLWPCINVQDLIQGKSLLIFLNARAQNPPSVFAHADFEAIRLGQVSQAVGIAFLNEYTVYLDGLSVSAYGRIVSWDEDDNAFDDMISGRARNVGEGLLILEIQKGIMEFLVGCCYAIFHDLDRELLTSSSVDAQLEPPAIGPEPTECPTLAAMAAEAPYRVPANLNFEQLQAVIAAKRSAVEDHVWALREDPGYFYEIVGDEAEHRLEQLPDTRGNKHPHLNDSLFWARVYGSVITSAYGSLIVFDYLHRQVASLGTLKEKYARNITPHRDLPAEYLKALLMFKATLENAANGPIMNLQMGFPAAPGFRSLFVREPQVAGTSKLNAMTRSGVKLDDMLWTFQAIISQDQRHLCGLPALVDELERLIQRDSKEKQRLTAWLANTYSDLAVIAGSMHQINIYQPWAAAMEQQEPQIEAEIKETINNNLSKLADIVGNMNDAELEKIGLESPLDGRYNYPADKRRTKQHAEAMRSAERSLDSFW